MKTKRKIIQVSVAPESDHYPELIYALCNDGTIWKLDIKYGDGWIEIENVPQD